MNYWRKWLSWWLAPVASFRRTDMADQSQERPAEELSSQQALVLLRHAAAGHPANSTPMQAAAQRLQRDLGNRGVQLLAEQSGDKLPPALRDKMSSQLGDDLADVRLHTGPAGAEIARLAGADAVTIGEEIAFDSGKFDPASPAGEQLLAHELAHTVQSGGSEAGDAERLEQAAQRGQPAAGTAGPGQVLRQAAKPWRERVAAAKAETDPKVQRTLLTALVQEALATGYQVNVVAATPASGAVDPAQYQAAPAINFDFNLENKEYWPGAGRKGKLGPRTGYFFSSAGKGYAIIGPGAIEESTPALTRMAADHELFHATHHMGKGVADNQELEAWVDAFVHYFHQVYTARKSWLPLIMYYEGADSSARKKALDALVAYFGQQPADIQRAILNWLARRKRDSGSKQLVVDLTAKLPASVAPAKP